MRSTQALSLGVWLFLAAILAGCGSSTPDPSSGSSPLRITTQSPLPSGRFNTAYSVSFTATGGTPPYAWSASNVPPGLVMSTSGALAGTPTQAGSFTVAVAVSDSVQGSANGSFAVTIAPPLQITTNSLPNGSPGLAYQSALAATGGFSPYTWSISQGSLPGGLTLNASSGFISGTLMSTGTSNFTIQVADNGTPPATANANLSITSTPPPARSAALYTADGGGFQITSNGSLALLASSPEPAGAMAASPTLPLLFTVGANGGQQNQQTGIESVLVNPDYSLSLYSAGVLPSGSLCSFYTPSVDPTGSNLYLPGCIDSSGDNGILIYPADGSLTLLNTVSVPNGQQVLPGFTRLVFTPDGTQAFLGSCTGSSDGTIISYSRSSDGNLTTAATYALPTGSCASSISVSVDGRFLAEGELSTSAVQVFSIGSDGTLTPVSQRLVVTFDQQGTATQVADLTWDESGTFLLVATISGEPDLYYGGMAVLSFSGGTLSETVYPAATPGSLENVVRDGSLVYSKLECERATCSGIMGFTFQNGQLTLIPGSPWQYNSDSTVYQLVIY